MDNYSSASFPPPREFQDTAHNALREGVRDGHRLQCVMSPTGSGKTYLGMRVIHEALLRDKRAMFVCDRTTLINQTSAVADSYGLSAHSVMQASHWRFRADSKFQIASAQTLARRGWPDADVIVIDECFPGDTLIATPDGAKRIADIKAGDLVLTACGIAPAKSIFSKQVAALITVRLSNGTQFECTEDHPVFTDAGWINAGVLERGAGVFGIEDVRSLWRDDNTAQREHRDSTGIGDSVQSSSVLREILRKEIEEPDAQRRQSNQNGGDIEASRPSAENSWRQWVRDDGGSEIGFVETWPGVGTGIHSQNETETCRRIPASLQTRFGEPGNDGGDRTGRRQPLRECETGAGREEGCVAEVIRVESVTPSESNGHRVVFNLRVSGHPSYFANGILVHNCHTLYKSWTDHVKDCRATVIGLSATPFSVGMGNIFTRLVNAATMDQLTRDGTLVPMRVLSGTRIDMRGAKTIGGEWSDGAAAERGMEIIGDVVTEWARHADNRKTIVFGATIAHCEEMSRQFNEAGFMAATFTADTLPEARAQLLKEFAKPDSLRVLISVEALAKGFDVKDVGCVCDCRPLRKSLSTAIQMWGRGLRSSPETGKTDCLLLDFSGNIVRFADDYGDIFYNGLDALDSGEKLDKAVRKADEDEETGKPCPKCGYKPVGKRCVACGWEHVSASHVEHEAGELVEFMVGKATIGDKLRVWEEAVTYCRGVGNPETAKGRAAHLYKSITGVFPRNLPEFDATNNVPISRGVVNKARANMIAFRKAA